MSYQIVRDFEKALCDYTGAPYCVTVTSCTMALLLAVSWYLRDRQSWMSTDGHKIYELNPTKVEIPKRTYVGVPMSVIHAGGWPTFDNREWLGYYQLRPFEIYDAARWLYSGMYQRDRMICLSFHPTKHLGISTHGGAILHDNFEADYWLRRARFDGRQESIPPKNQVQESWIIGWHCYMNPVTAAEGLTRLATLPKHNDPLPNSDYPDLSTLEIFK